VSFFLLHIPPRLLTINTRSFSVGFTADKIVYGREARLTISFTQPYRGRYEDRAEILFEDTQLGKEFVIVRALRVIVGSRADHAALKPTAPYVPRKRTNRAPASEVVPGVVSLSRTRQGQFLLGSQAPESNAVIRWVVPLPHAEIPTHISLALKHGSTRVQVENIKNTALPRSFDAATYGRHFKTLLWVEEFQMEYAVRILVL